MLSNTFQILAKPFQSLVFVSNCFHLSVSHSSPHIAIRNDSSIIGLLVVILTSLVKIKDINFGHPFYQILNGF